MTNVDLSNDEEIRLEIQRLDAEEQAALIMAEGTKNLLSETLIAVRDLGPRLQQAMEDNNIPMMHEGLDEFIAKFTMISELIPGWIDSLKEASFASFYKEQYELLLTLPEGE